MKNLTEKQKRGIKSLKRKQKEGEIVIFQTDKSGKLAADTPDNYTEAARPHIEKDMIVTQKEYEDVEKLINAHSLFWMRMLRVGEETGDQERYKRSMKTENSKSSTLYMFRKDHKQCEDDNKGPPVRPLCDVSDSYGHKLSYFASNILKEVTDKEPTVCDSTEDMLAGVREANESGKISEGTVIGSLDVKALYPSLDLDHTIEIAAEEFRRSDVEIEGVNNEELGLYLSLNRSEEYLRNKGVDVYCPKRKRRGPPPKITGSGVKTKKEERYEPWVRATQEPDKDKQRVMITEAIKIVMEVLMKNHIYEFKEELRKQKEGGAIGIDLTGELAKIYMTWWDKELIKKLGEIGIDPILYKRYVDDIVIIVMKIIGESEEDGEADERTIERIREIGETIHSSIKLTKEVPSENEDKKLPVLDLKTWIEEVEMGDEKEYKVLHEYYMKKVASKALIHREAALSMKDKRTILTQECYRIMKNCHELAGRETLTGHLTHYMARMQAAGYDKSFRAQVLRSAFKANERMKQQERDGVRPVYRARNWKRKERRKEKLKKAKEWYKTGGNESVLFITATPESELKGLLQEVIEKSKIKIKVVEKSGKKMMRILQKNNPFAKRECGKEDCMVCTGDRGGSCRETGITYCIDCTGVPDEGTLRNNQNAQGEQETCAGVYNGETGRNAYTRGLKHKEEYDKRVEGSAMWKHCVQHHNSERQYFRMKVKDQVRNDATKRQILEAVRIERTEEGERMNSRGEWGSNRIPRIEVKRD